MSDPTAHPQQPAAAATDAAGAAATAVQAPAYGDGGPEAVSGAPGSAPAALEALAARAASLDAADPLAAVRDRFALDDTVYLDGNSLGALSTGVLPRLTDVVTREWGELRIRSWEESGWWTAPERIGDRIAPLVGAA